MLRRICAATFYQPKAMNENAVKKPPARVAAIPEPESQEILQGQIDATLRVAEARAQKRRDMRERILANDAAGALALACELAGFSQREATQRVEGMLASVIGSAP
jgi:hypothetical protein